MAKANGSNPEIEIKASLKGAENWKEWCKEKGNSSASSHGTSGALYFVGFVGSLVYWMQAATNFGAVITGFLKSMVWPAYVVFKMLEAFYGKI